MGSAVVSIQIGRDILGLGPTKTNTLCNQPGKRILLTEFRRQ